MTYKLRTIIESLVLFLALLFIDYMGEGIFSSSSDAIAAQGAGLYETLGGITMITATGITITGAYVSSRVTSTFMTGYRSEGGSLMYDASDDRIIIDDRLEQRLERSEQELWESEQMIKKYEDEIFKLESDIAIAKAKLIETENQEYFIGWISDSEEKSIKLGINEIDNSINYFSMDEIAIEDSTETITKEKLPKLKSIQEPHTKEQCTYWCETYNCYVTQQTNNQQKEDSIMFKLWMAGAMFTGYILYGCLIFLIIAQIVQTSYRWVNDKKGVWDLVFANVLLKFKCANGCLVTLEDGKPHSISIVLLAIIIIGISVAWFIILPYTLFATAMMSVRGFVRFKNKINKALDKKVDK